MYVKSLTMKGFKSFASSTTMRLEPGITCVVGPNGSGKSNVVDALAWVMGEQGAKTLRGGKMEDVIFAGTAVRPPLGRAEVSLTIDNTDGALPIDYTEVTLSRTMFRNGGSDYAINATPCRLLDIQELLSDSGIGREMHVIVGQGQLDVVLRATPEDRRGFIEEAAGVLKHRKRKERALRKLEAMEANLTRISDLTGEIRRQLGPLGRQAETARRAAVVQTDARDARLRLLADDLVQLTSTVEQEVADESALLAERHRVEAGSAAARERLETLEASEARIAPLVGAAAQRWYALSSLRERVQATGALAAERQRLLGEAEEQDHAPGRDPQVLLAQAQEARTDEQRLQSEVDQAGAALDGAVQARTLAEAEHAQEQVRLAALVGAAADRREGLARLSGQVGAAASRIQTLQTSLDRLRESAQASAARADQAGQEYARLEGSVAAAEEGEEGLDSRYENAERQLLQARSEVEELAEQERVALAERTSLVARREALELGLAAKDGAGYLLETDEVQGVIGTVAALLQVEPEHAVALEVALGWAADAVAIESVAGAQAALRTLRAEEAGSVRLLVAGASQSRTSQRSPAAAGTTWASDLVTCPAELAAAVDELLAGVVLVADLEAAGDLVRAHPDLTAVTAEGDVLAARRAAGGGRSVPGELATRAAVEETRSREQDTLARAQRARFAVAAARDEAARLEQEAGQALDALNESDARMSAVAERLGELAGTVRAARAEHERTQTSIGQAERELAQSDAARGDLAVRLAAAQDAPDEQEPASGERDRLAQQASQARAGETERRLALRTHEERVRALHERVAALESAAHAEQEARVRQAERAQRRRREAAMAASVQRGVALAEPMLTRSLGLAAAERDQTERERVEVGVELAAVRRSASGLDARLRELTDSVHRDEVARAQQRMRIEALHARAVDELGIDPEALVEGYGPHQLVPVVPDPQAPADADVAPPAAYVREVQEKRLRGAERKLAQLGRVNPLALEEYAALEERHAFLTRQLEDLRGSRHDLLDIVREVDERVQRVFAEAFADTAAHFEQVFARLFPGGEGRLILTDPDDMLLTGIEVEARPPGKKIKRLSLLSGGERSLVAVALLVSIFKARPSPFYIMDEVEAALDDANLGRLLTLMEELRDTSQLIVITHQKRTMEIADALYGATMRGDGVTTIVSQRMRELVDQPA